MKRTLSLILALVMALSLAACGKKDDGNADAPADSLALLTKDRRVGRSLRRREVPRCRRRL